MKSINTKIGENLKKIRKSRGLTIDSLALNSGVSKSMISEIERGLRNPSISILWDIANALKTPLNYFLKEDNLCSPTIYKMGDHSSIDGDGYSFHTLMNFDEDKKFEIYFNEYMPNSQTETSFHYDGVEEYVLITSGSLNVHIDSEKFTIKEGEVIHFVADKPHYYCNETGNVAKAFILMFYSDSM
ncbi:XRE family transcriptional regulator (plasmid) [Clostridium estertheticum]|uniref:helix-turn-helix domain-containing protein n=1 Tax=Clostridium estertheticum TaxID=238834 RepID=UPI001C0C2F9B|nr:XRE family transcriptional regulator [Clostridium estertheticum]MBU3217367.1 XRE family transcriptional regulator [Clostridium estertheticum]WAG58141.1 XRE family transcriptional regulator [Clostridium estertheticum]